MWYETLYSVSHTFTGVTDTITDREENGGKEQLLEVNVIYVNMLATSRLFMHNTSHTRHLLSLLQYRIHDSVI